MKKRELYRKAVFVLYEIIESKPIGTIFTIYELEKEIKIMLRNNHPNCGNQHFIVKMQKLNNVQMKYWVFRQNYHGKRRYVYIKRPNEIIRNQIRGMQ